MTARRDPGLWQTGEPQGGRLVRKNCGSSAVIAVFSKEPNLGVCGIA
jgi:hypothetical protein